MTGSAGTARCVVDRSGDRRECGRGRRATASALPIRLVVTDDLERSRLTVFFRLLLAIPHLIWSRCGGSPRSRSRSSSGWRSSFEGRAPRTLHGFVASYLRYSTHVSAYVHLAADPYPAFRGARLSGRRRDRAAAAPVRGRRRLPARARGARAPDRRRARRRRTRDVVLPRSEPTGQPVAASARSDLRSSAGSPASCSAACRAGCATWSPTASATPRRRRATSCSSPTATRRATLRASCRRPRCPTTRSRLELTDDVAALAADGLLPAAARYPAPRLARALERSSSLAGRRRLGRGARDRPRARARCTGSSPRMSATPRTSAPSCSSSAARSPASSGPPAATRSTSRSTAGPQRRLVHARSGSCSRFPRCSSRGALRTACSASWRCSAGGRRSSPAGCRRAAQPRRRLRPLQRRRSTPTSSSSPTRYPVRGARSSATAPSDEQLALELGRPPDASRAEASRPEPHRSDARRRAAVAAAWLACASLLLRTAVPGGLDLPDVDVDAVFGTRARRARRRASSASSSSRGCSSRSCCSARCGSTRGAGPRYVRESAAGPIGTGMLLGMLGLGIVWLVQLPFGLLDLWWARRHDLTELGLPRVGVRPLVRARSDVRLDLRRAARRDVPRPASSATGGGSPAPPSSSRSPRCSPSPSPYLVTGHRRRSTTPRCAGGRDLRARTGHLRDPRLGRGRQRDDEPGERLRRRVRRLAQDRALEHDARRLVLGRRGAGRARPRDRPSLERPHPEEPRLVRAASPCPARGS